MSQAATQLKVAGQVYRVVTSAPTDELERLAARVEDALAQVTAPGRQAPPQAFVLAALTLAHDLEEERARYRALEARHRAFVENVLGRVENALGGELQRGELQRDELQRDGLQRDSLAHDEPALAEARSRSAARQRRESR
ncbi:MAG TPA: cell division protein ZapA [Polyangiaceae bacterium]|nr:cell division protein ZapA [Polyangiaceae bacterium]